MPHIKLTDTLGLPRGHTITGRTVCCWHRETHLAFFARYVLQQHTNFSCNAVTADINLECKIRYKTHLCSLKEVNSYKSFVLKFKRISSLFAKKLKSPELYDLHNHQWSAWQKPNVRKFLLGLA